MQIKFKSILKNMKKLPIMDCGFGLMMLLLQMAIYFLLLSYGITPQSLSLLESMVEWILWDPKIFLFRLHDAGISIIAAAYSLYQRDWQGLKQLLKTQITVGIITEGLKYAVGRIRPDGSDTKSFPSGHASAAFCGAAYIHNRYGLPMAIPAYFAASIVGCVRVHKLKHFPTDVFAGAGIAILTAYHLVKSQSAPSTESPTRGVRAYPKLVAT